MDIDDIKKVHGKRKHKILNSIGVYDIYKWLRKNKWPNIPRPIKEAEFYSIIRGVNQYLAEGLSRGEDVILPYHMGRLELRKKPATVTYEKGKVKTNRPIDWDTTLKLWCDDENAYEKKTLVRQRCDEIYKVYYNRVDAKYINKTFYAFTPNRELKTELKHKIKNKQAFAFKLYEYME